MNYHLLIDLGLISAGTSLILILREKGNSFKKLNLLCIKYL